MAIYSYNQITSQYELKERPLYAASRVGTLRNIENELNYQYELTDHLGNVRALFSKKDDGSLSFNGARDYYPFGSAMPGRSWNETGTYRFGYQGQFAEDETYSIKYTDKDGKTQYKETGFHNFELRMWDSKIGRWHTTDPYNQFWSSYVGMGNNPISLVDPDGGWTPNKTSRGQKLVPVEQSSQSGYLTKSGRVITQNYYFNLQNTITRYQMTNNSRLAEKQRLLASVEEDMLFSLSVASPNCSTPFLPDDFMPTISVNEHYIPSYASSNQINIISQGGVSSLQRASLRNGSNIAWSSSGARNINQSVALDPTSSVSIRLQRIQPNFGNFYTNQDAQNTLWNRQFGSSNTIGVVTAVPTFNYNLRVQLK